jgi:ribokinase
MSPRICVIGSSNTDMVIRATKLPAPGETVIGGTFLMNPGGKGANQAVAAARLMLPAADKPVAFVATVGNDVFGREALDQFEREGIRTDFVTTDPDEPSGIALIGVDSQGENCIMVASGANAQLAQAQVAQALAAVPDTAVVLLQLETPIQTVEYAIRESHKRGMRVVLNPAPAQPLDPAILPCLYAITPNETEAELLTGIRVTDEATAQRAARWLHDAGVANVVITLGARGAYLSSGAEGRLIAAPTVTAVDTTAAGDCFNGALAVALAENRNLSDAVAFACQAASISVTRLGAQASMPHRHEVDTLPVLTV